MNAHPHQFTAEPTEDGMAYLCCGCDAVRAGPLAWCADCEEVTESYLYPADGSIRGADLTIFEAETLDMLWNGSLGLAPTSQAGMGGVWA